MVTKYIEYKYKSLSSPSSPTSSLEVTDITRVNPSALYLCTRMHTFMVVSVKMKKY